MEEKVLIESKRSSGIVWLIIGIVVWILAPVCFILFGGYSADWWIIAIMGGAGFFLFFFLPVRVLMAKTQLIVSNKRVYGKTTFGKRVDLPLDSVTAISLSLFKGISISTASGRIGFKLIANRDEIYNAVSDLLRERQQKPIAETTIRQEIPQSNADELKKFKDLLDSGVITQEEFDAKKKQLLGL